MITVKLFGGAKKSLSTDKLSFEKDDSTISELVDFLQKHIKENMPPLDIKNVLVAVNGADSSTLEGFATKLKDGDVVSIIPVIHGGRVGVQFDMFDTSVEFLELKYMDDPVKFLEDLRKKHKELVIQGIKPRYILNKGHAKKIIAISLAAQKSGTMLSNKIETDILMRFSCTKQISEAIKKVGLEQKQDFILIVIGKKLHLDKLFSEIKTNLKDSLFSRNNSTFLQKEFKISKRQFQSILSKTPLEDILAEKAAVLFR